MSLGTLAPAVVELPLQGRVGMAIIIKDQNDTVVSLVDRIVQLVISSRSGEALITKRSDETGLSVISPSTAGQIFVELEPEEAALLSPNALYTFAASVLRTSDEVAVSVYSGYVIPVNYPISNYPTLDSDMALSISYINVRQLLGEAGGTNYLDGLVTATQTVGCIVRYIDPADGQPLDWVLELSTQASVAGSYRRPLDYNAFTNAKVWRKIS